MTQHLGYNYTQLSELNIRFHDSNMRTVFRFLLLLLTLLCANNSYAAKIYECIDTNGNKSFRDRCPEGTQIAEELQVGPKKKKQEFDVILYTITNCRKCESVSQYLQKREIEYSVKNISGSDKLQRELKLLAGSLKIPTTVVNESVSSGYNEDELLEMLKKAGWKPLPEE